VRPLAGGLFLVSARERCGIFRRFCSLLRNEGVDDLIADLQPALYALKKKTAKLQLSQRDSVVLSHSPVTVTVVMAQTIF